MPGINLNTRSNTWVFWNDQPKTVSCWALRRWEMKCGAFEIKMFGFVKAPKIQLLIYSNIHHMEEPVECPLTVQYDGWSSVCLFLFAHCLL